MLYLLLAIVSTSLLAIIMRVGGKYLKSNLGMTFFNYVICFILAAFCSGVGNLFPKAEGFRLTFGLGLFTGIIYLVGLLLTQLNIQKNGVVLSTIFQKLGLIVQVLLSIIIFGEHPGMIQIVGIIICLIAVVMINFEKGQSTIPFKVGLILLLLTSGFCDGMSKVHEELGDPSLSEHFLFYTFGMAMILGGVLLIKNKVKIGWMDIGFGILLGVANFFTCRFLLKSLSVVPAVVAYPTFSVGAVVLVTLAGVIVFKERLSRRQWTSLGMILVALAFLNM